MSRTAIWLANSVLVVLCCFLVARILTEVAAEVLVPTAAYASAPPPSVTASTGWDERQVILARNLFDASTLAPSEAEVEASEEETYEKTRLPVRLLATVAGSEAVSWAAVEDLDSRDVHVVRVSDQLKGRAEVTRIERRRIVLRNGGRLEELALDEQESPGTVKARPRASLRNARRSARANPRDSRIQRLAENRYAVSRTDVEQMTQNPAVFSQARILPKYENGQMVGVQLNAIKKGSLFEKIGIQNGDVIQELNGIQISNQQDSAAVLRELTEASEFNATVVGSDGNTRTQTYEIRN